MLKLNIGCGHTNFGDDWVHIDNIHEPHISWNNITSLPYEDNMVDVIYSSHTLEYFDREEVLNVLKEWYRVLKVGGKIYLSVPDFRAMAKLYIQNDTPLHRLLGPLYGKMASGDKLIYHKTVWDEASLGEYLRIVGFRRIDTWQDGGFYSWEERVNIDFSTHDDCSNAMITNHYISLNLVATKNEYEKIPQSLNTKQTNN